MLTFVCGADDLISLCLTTRGTLEEFISGSGRQVFQNQFKPRSAFFIGLVRTSTSSTGSLGRWAARGKGTHWGGMSG